MLTHKILFVLFILLFILLFSGCTETTRQLTKHDGFIVVKPLPQDDLSSLAKQYLGSEIMASVIADFNQTDTISANQEIIIPLEPFYPAGINHKNYQTVPVLVYHRIEDNNPNKMVVTEKSFREQMKYLKDNQYQPISLDQLIDFMEFKAALPKKAVVITFDDGWLSTYKKVMPVLKEFNFPATLFVYTDLIGKSKMALNWPQIKTLSENGFDIQCHSKSHRDLSKLKPGESFDRYFKALQEEISFSKKLIEEKINTEVKYLAFPYGTSNSIVTLLLKEHGFKAAFTVKRGSTPAFVHPYLINRSMIYGEYSLKNFQKNLKVVKNN